jgi:hypothetical protein
MEFPIYVQNWLQRLVCNKQYRFVILFLTKN